MPLEQLSGHACFEGKQSRYRHDSDVLGCAMHFSVFLPPQSRSQRVPALYWLSGLSCTDENFAQKAGAQRYAARHGLALIMPDTSPRGDGVADAPDGGYDLGLGAGFYVNATEDPWHKHYQMYDYISHELPRLIAASFPAIDRRRSIMGHSMGGHGALIIALRNPRDYCSVSAFAPICSASRSPWGIKALTAYLGADQSLWQDYDASRLVLASKDQSLPIFVDQGTDDEFLEQQLRPDLLRRACLEADYPLQLNMRPGYDHSYYFIATFIGEHIQYHAQALNAGNQS